MKVSRKGILLPIANTVIFLLLVTLAYSTWAIDALFPFFAVTIVFSLGFMIFGIVKKLGIRYFFISVLPTLTAAVLSFLLFAEVGWLILALFGLYGPIPN